MATPPAKRIRRISLDAGTPANYTLQATTTYDATAPAENPSSWGDAAAVTGMDQLLSVPAPPAVEVIGNMGVLVTFARFPKYLNGVIVKIRPTYDADAGQDPSLTYWTYNSAVAAWTMRQQVMLRSDFEGVQSGRLKYFDFRADNGFEDITAVWVTLNEGTVAGATVAWLAVHAFGACDRPKHGGGGGGGGCGHPGCPSCTSSDCIDPTPCEDGDEDCPPTEETCRDLAIRYGYDPDICDMPPEPDWPVPDFPLIDFCDQEALAAYKATLTPAQLAWLEELLAAVDLPCLDPEDKTPNEISPINEDDEGDPVLPAQPIEEYVDPENLNDPGVDPDPRAEEEKVVEDPPIVDTVSLYLGNTVQSALDGNFQAAIQYPPPALTPNGYGPRFNGDYQRTVNYWISNPGFYTYHLASSLARAEALHACTPQALTYGTLAGPVEYGSAEFNINGLPIFTQDSPGLRFTADEILNFLRIRLTWDIAVTQAKVEFTLKFRGGQNIFVYIDQASYAASSNANKILFEILGEQPTLTSYLGKYSFTWLGYSSLGPIDITVVEAQLNDVVTELNGEACGAMTDGAVFYANHPFVLMEMTLTTTTPPTGSHVTGLEIRVQN